MRAFSISFVAALACLVSATPGRAQTFGLVGDWRGEGAMIFEDAGTERLRCRLTGTLDAPALWKVHIRCAKLQGQIDMTLSMSIDANGVIVGQGEVKGEKAEAAEFSGTLVDNSLRVETEVGMKLALIRRDDGLYLEAWQNAKEDGFIWVLFPM